jgi:hypothetical protein
VADPYSVGLGLDFVTKTRLTALPNPPGGRVLPLDVEPRPRVPSPNATLWFREEDGWKEVRVFVDELLEPGAIWMIRDHLGDEVAGLHPSYLDLFPPPLFSRYSRGVLEAERERRR